MKLYGYWRSSTTYRVNIVRHLKELEMDYVPVHLVKDGGEQKKKEYQNVNPQKLVPSLELDDGKVLTQSLAIIEYLEEYKKTPSILPEDAYGKAIVRSMSQVIACEIHPIDNLRVLQYLTGVLEVDAEQKSKWYKHWIEEGFSALERLLEKHSGKFCFADTVSLADICLVPQVYNAERFEVPLDAFPRIMQVCRNCEELPAFIKSRPANQPDAQ